MKRTKTTSPWLAVTLGILGLAIGYVSVLTMNDPHVFTHAMFRCPASHSQPAA